MKHLSDNNFNNNQLDNVPTPTDASDAANKEYVDTKAPRRFSMDNLVYPVYIGHRGARALYPEASMEGLRACVESGFIAELDLQQLSTGELVLSHDETADRTMIGVSGAISSLTATQWRQARIKPAIPGGTEAESVFFEDVLNQIVPMGVISPEVKGTGPIVQAFIDKILEYGAQDAVMAQTMTFAAAQTMTAAGLRVIYVITGNETTPSASTIASAGVEWVFKTGLTLGEINTFHAAGLKVSGTASPMTKAQGDAMIALGYDSVLSPDPWIVSGRQKVTSGDGFAEGFGWPGMKFTRGSTVGPGVDNISNVRLSGKYLTTERSDLAEPLVMTYLPQFGKIDLPCRIRAKIRISDTAEPGTTGIVLFNNPNKDEFVDGATPGQNAYQVLFFSDGRIRSYTYEGGAAASQTGTQSTSGPETASPSEIDLVVTYTGTRILVEELNSGATLDHSKSFTSNGNTLAIRTNSNSITSVSDISVERL